MPHAVSPQSEFLHTVILRPTQPCRIMDAPFLTIDSAIATQTGLQSHPSLQPRYQVRYLDRSNQLAVDATSSQVRDALLKITYIPIDKKQVPVQAYEAIRRGQTRGFIKNAIWIPRSSCSIFIVGNVPSSRHDLSAPLGRR
ncbi:unnamed protein product [Ixodes persulcatus]